MEQFYLGVDAGEEKNTLTLLDERKRLFASCELAAEENILPAVRKKLLKDCADSVTIRAIGVTGDKRYSIKVRADSIISDTVALNTATEQYYKNAVTTVFVNKNADRAKIIFTKNGKIKDFITVNNYGALKLKEFPIKEPVLFAGADSEYLKFKKIFALETEFADNAVLLPSLGACLFAKKAVCDTEIANIKNSNGENEMNFKTYYCNACQNKCAVSALIFNGQIKATFGAKCDSPKIFSSKSIFA